VQSAGAARVPRSHVREVPDGARAQDPYLYYGLDDGEERTLEEDGSLLGSRASASGRSGIAPSRSCGRAGRGSPEHLLERELSTACPPYQREP